MSHPSTGDAQPVGTTSTTRMVVAAWAIAGAMTAAYAWLLSEVPLKSDDFNYLLWGLERRGDPLAWTWGTWSPHYRPLNGLVWWVSAQTGIDATLERLVQIGLWMAILAAVGVFASRRNGTLVAVAVVVLLAYNQVFADLLQWRSWLTTTGTLVGLTLGLVELGRERPRIGVMIAAGILALGFKETGGLVLGVAMLVAAPRRLGWLGGALGLLAVLFGSAARYKLGWGWVGQDVLGELSSLGQATWALPLLVAAAFPALDWRIAGSTALAVVLPAPVGGVLVIVASALVVRSSLPHALGLVVAWGLPLWGSKSAWQYALEGWLLVVVAIGGRRGLRFHPGLLAIAFVAGVPAARDFWVARWPERAAIGEQRAQAKAVPARPATTLCVGSPDFEMGVDVLVLVARGATFLEEGCGEGSRPTWVSEPSEVWVDAAR